jgi:hypothetical protein
LTNIIIYKHTDREREGGREGGRERERERESESESERERERERDRRGAYPRTKGGFSKCWI